MLIDITSSPEVQYITELSQYNGHWQCVTVYSTPSGNHITIEIEAKQYIMLFAYGKKLSGNFGVMSDNVDHSAAEYFDFKGEILSEDEKLQLKQKILAIQLSL